MEGVSSAAVCLYRLRRAVYVCVCVSRKRRDDAVLEEGVGRFFFSINLLFIITGCSLSSLFNISKKSATICFLCFYILVLIVEVCSKCAAFFSAHLGKYLSVVQLSVLLNEAAK